MALFGEVGDVQAFDATVRLRLAQSLEHIYNRTCGHLDIDQGRVEAAVANIRAKKQDPGVFARYYELIFAVTAGDFDTVDILFEELSERSADPAVFAIVPYSREGLGADYDRFPRLLFSEYSQINPMATPADAQSAAATRMLHDGIEIIRGVDRSIYDEISALLVRILLAVGSQDPSAKRFAGVTSFLVWGASFMNIEAYRTRWDAVQFLVHEITHGFLFALACDEPLVQNSSKESYKSPLRTDTRPMDGIFHATLVCARLAAFNMAWLDSGALEGVERDNSEKAVVENLRSFRDGLAVVEQRGKLSEQAWELIGRSRQGLGMHQ